MDGPAAPRSLGLDEDQPYSPPALKSLPDDEPTSDQVDVLPPEPQCLPNSKPGRAQDNKERPEPVFASVVEKSHELFGR